MAYIVKSGLYHLSNVAIHNDIINCVTSDLKEQVVKLNGKVVEDDKEFQNIMRRLRASSFLGEKWPQAETDITEIDYVANPQ